MLDFNVISSDIQAALESCKDSLQHVCLDHGDGAQLEHGWWFFSNDEIEPMSFRGLHRLKQLKIDGVFLWGTAIIQVDFRRDIANSYSDDFYPGHTLALENRESFINSFPQSLESLHIAYQTNTCPLNNMHRLGWTIDGLIEENERVVRNLQEIRVEDLSCMVLLNTSKICTNGEIQSTQHKQGVFR